MTQKEELQITKLKNEALTEYLYFCLNKKEIPREELILLINGCEDEKALNDTILIVKAKTFK